MHEDAKLLHDMVSISSESGHEAELASFLVDAMLRRGFSAHVDEAGNAVGEQGDGPEETLLLGHMDTVPGWIPVRIADGLLYGRGSVDAKGPLAAFICAGTRVGARVGKRLRIVGAVEEESVSSRGARHLLTGRRPAAVIIGEPSGWERITIGYKGRLLAHYRVARGMSHTAGMDRGVCEDAVAFWQGVNGYAHVYNETHSRRSETIDVSLRHMHSDSDGLSQQAELTIGIRIPPDLDPAQAQGAIRQLGDPGAELNFYGAEYPYRAAKNTRLVAALLSAIRAKGGSPAFSFKTGTSDMNVVGPAWGCPIAAYGPGDSTLDHTPEEHVSLEEYGRAIDVLTEALGSL